MKKLLILLLCFIMFFTFSSCNTTTNNANTDISSAVNGIEIKEPIDNSVNGYRISDSKNESVPDFTDTQGKTQENNDILYYANTNTKKFHLKSCASAEIILDENLYICDSREELIDKGYKSCGRCKP